MPRYAAVDIGSNSVRLLVCEVNPGAPLRVLASEREVTRLGEGVFRSGRIEENGYGIPVRAVVAHVTGHHAA